MKKLYLVFMLMLVTSAMFANGLFGSWVYTLNSDRSVHLKLEENKNYSFTVMFHTQKTSETTGVMEVTEDKKGLSNGDKYVVGKMLMTSSEGKEIIFDYVHFPDNNTLIVVMANGSQQTYERLQ